MKTERNSEKGTAARRRPSGIPAAAAALGVDRTHLWRVLRGQRRSDRLMRRYRELEGAGTMEAAK